MIAPEIFRQQFTGLAAYHKHELNPDFISTQYDILSENLTTEEFQQACKNMLRRRFFPSLDEMIESVLGTLEERAIAQLANLDRLSVVGAKALESIGGEWELKRSSHFNLLKRDFITAYVAFAKFAKPSDLRMPEPADAISPTDYPLLSESRIYCFLPYGTRLNNSGEYEFIWQNRCFMEEPTAEEVQKIFLEVIEKSAQRNRLCRIIEGIHVLKDPSPTLLKTFNSPDHQKVIDVLKNLARTALEVQKKQSQEASWLNQ